MQMRRDPEDIEQERDPVPAENYDDRDVEPMGENHRPDDPVVQPEELRDPTGQKGPAYEENQGDPGGHDGGSVDPNDGLSHADSGDEDVR